MSPEQADFAQSGIVSTLGLPKLTETFYHLICYRTPLPTTTCTPDPIEYVTGPIVDYATVAKPTRFQCYSLLTSQWPWVTYWFNRLFPTFEGPASITYTNLNTVKTVLKMWILEFGPAEMDTWTDIKAAMNGVGENWQNYLAWIDSDSGFSTDAGATVHPFPAKLLASLQASSYGRTSQSDELKQTINKYSTVCNNADCSSTMKGYCAQVSVTNACAQS